MHSVLLTLGSLVWLVVATASVLLCALLLRHPRAPHWTRSEGVAVAASLLLTAELCIAVMQAIDAMSAVKMHYALSGLVIFVTFIVSLRACWWALQVGERLRLADEGYSPFAHVGKRSEQTTESRTAAMVS